MHAHVHVHAHGHVHAHVHVHVHVCMCMCMCACPRVCASERRQKATLHASSILRKVREGPGGEEVLVLRWEGHDFELPRQP